ncbi:uncharacterized protein J3R85_001060 [Psidium guajava]|nr:uncharacterized protein J3R85_001060 [Psidium guajava]
MPLSLSLRLLVLCKLRSCLLLSATRTRSEKDRLLDGLFWRHTATFSVGGFSFLSRLANLSWLLWIPLSAAHYMHFFSVSHLPLLHLIVTE